jgi:ribosomal protein S18 acetylase RimI-like enzyme
METEPFIRLADPNSKTDLTEAAKIINEAFLKQFVARTDQKTTSAKELKHCLLTVQADHVYIWCVSIALAFQGQDLGIKLMQYMEKRALEVHHRKIAIVTVVYHPLHTQESLMRWYEKQGYKYTQTKLAQNKFQYWKPEFHKGLRLKEFKKVLAS